MKLQAMHWLIIWSTFGFSLCDGRLVLKNDDFSLFDGLIREMVSKILLKEFENNKCLVALSDVPEDLAYLDPWYHAIIRVSLTSGDVPVKRLLVSAMDADCRGLVVQCRDAAAGVYVIFKAFKLAITRVTRRLLVLPVAHSPHINVSEIFALRNIDLVPDILVARMADNNDSCDLVTLSLTGEETWREEKVVARWFRGRGLHPPAVELYPERAAGLAGRRLTLATFNYPPYVILDSDANLFDGVETRIILEFITKMNATWRVIQEKVHKWGAVWANVSGTGIFGAVAADVADLGYNGIYTWYPEYLLVEYSRPYMRAGATCLAPRPLLLPAWQVPLLPFPPALWAAVGGSVVVTTAALYAVKKFSDHVFGPDAGGADGRYSTVSDCFFRSVGLLVLQSPAAQRRHSRVVGPTRHVLSWLLIAYLLVTAIYSSGLSSVLSIPRYEPPIDTVADLHSSGLEWAQTEITYLNSLRGMTDRVYQDLFQRFRVLSPDAQRSRITTRDLAFGVERLPGGYFAVGDFINEEAVSKWLRPMREDIYWEKVVIAARKGWPYLDQLNNIIDRLLEAGIVDTWAGQLSRKWLAHRVQQAARLGLRWCEHAPDEPVKLQLTHVQGAFVLLIIGLCLSFIVLLLEIAIHWKTNRTNRMKLSSTK